MDENTNALDLVGPLQALALASEPSISAAAYDLMITSANGGLVRMVSGLTIETSPLSALDGLEIDTIIVPSGSLGAHQPMLTSWLRAQAPSARRVCGVGEGVLVLAEAGLLGHRAALHWHDLAMARSAYPEINARAHEILIRDGLCWTSAGMAASLHLALALIDEDLGRTAALKVAKRLIVFLWRRPDQSQISRALGLQIKGGMRFADLHDWITANPHADLRVEALAERAGMTPRTFARNYRRETGLTPARAVESIRVDLARNLLVNPRASLKQVAEQCGFGSELNLRRAFHRHLNLSPSDDRAQFLCETNLSGSGYGNNDIRVGALRYDRTFGQRPTEHPGCSGEA